MQMKYPERKQIRKKESVRLRNGLIVVNDIEKFEWQDSYNYFITIRFFTLMYWVMLSAISLGEPA